MENEEIVDSGIVGFTETDDLQLQLEELQAKYDTLEKEYNDLLGEKDEVESDLVWANNEIENLEERLERVITINDPMTIKLDVMDDLAIRLGRDGLLTPEFEEWLNNYNKFYLKDA